MSGSEYADHLIVGGGVELLRARFEHHVFERHIHDAYAIACTLRGVQRFWCRGATRDSSTGHVIAIAPGESHDGESGSAGGYAYHMVYVSPDRVRRALEDAHGRAAEFVLSAPLIADAALASRVDRAWRATSASPQSLASQELVDTMLVLLADRYGGLPIRQQPSVDSAALRRVREYLESSLSRAVRVDELAGIASMSRFQLSRQFQRTYGLPLHAFHLHLRLQEAHRRLRRGDAIAAVALDLGFADQSHLHRRFKGAFGYSPGTWRLAAQGSKTAGF